MVAPKRPRGRPRGDLALVLRNQLWGRAVYERSGLSWDALDVRFLGEPADGARPRLFWWIARIGVDPRSAHRKRSTIDLVTAVDQSQEFAGLKAMFESSLWALLTPPQRDWLSRRLLHRELLERLGLYQAEFPLRHAGAFALPDEPAFRPWSGNATRWISGHLADPSLDLIALLALSFQNALDVLELEEADCYLQALRRSLTAVHEHLRCTPELGRQLHALVMRRLLRNDWTGVESDRMSAPRSSRSRRISEHNRLGDASRRVEDGFMHLQEGLPPGARFVRSSPIVPMNNRLRDFLEDNAGKIRAQQAQQQMGSYASLQPMVDGHCEGINQ